MKIHDVLADKGRQVVTVWPEKQLGDIPRLFDERNIASVVVVDHAENPLGIVTDRDVLRASTHTRLTLPCSLPLMPALWYLHFGIDL